MYCYSRPIDFPSMLIRWLLTVLYQVFLLGVLAILPVIWLFGVGGFSYLELAWDLNFYALVVALVESRGEDLLLSTGLALILSSIIYLRLPIPLLPIYVPLFGRLDRLLATAVAIAGIIVVLFRMVHFNFLIS